MRSKLLVAGFALAAVTCHQVILTAPIGSTIAIFANPPFISSNGGRCVVSAIVIEPAGTPVPDGTVVQFFSDLGRIDEQAKTNDGVARANLLADGRSGSATITAVSGAATVTLADAVLIGNVNAVSVVVTADPQRIRPNEPRISTIVATVFDVNGNFAPGVPVTFSFEATPAEEEFLEGPGPVFTDSNGQAKRTLRTRRNREDPPKNVTVTATTPIAGVSGQTIVTVN